MAWQSSVLTADHKRGPKELCLQLCPLCVVPWGRGRYPDLGGSKDAEVSMVALTGLPAGCALRKRRWSRGLLASQSFPALTADQELDCFQR